MPFSQCFKVPNGSVQVNTIYRFAKLLAQYASLLTEVKLRPQTMVTQATLLAILYTVYGPIFTTALHNVFVRFWLTNCPPFRRLYFEDNRSFYKGTYISFIQFHVLPFFRNWILTVFLKWTKPRFSESRLKSFDKWWNLFDKEFIPIFVRLLLNISNFNCLRGQIMLLSKCACSVVHSSKLSFMTLYRWIAAW